MNVHYWCANAKTDRKVDGWMDGCPGRKNVESIFVGGIRWPVFSN